MAFETILHSGSFNDYNGEEIKVTFYRRVDLNANPTSLTFYVNSETRTLSIWSRVGDAILFDPTVDWLSYRKISSEKLVGCDYYKYTYEITCAANTSGNDRTSELNIGIEGMGGVKITVPVIQYNSENN